MAFFCIHCRSEIDPKFKACPFCGEPITDFLRRHLEAPIDGARVCIVAAADTVMTRPSAELMAEEFPGVRLTRQVQGRETLLSIERARAVLGYAPEHRWQDHVAAPPGTA